MEHIVTVIASHIHFILSFLSNYLYIVHLRKVNEIKEIIIKHILENYSLKYYKI